MPMRFHKYYVILQPLSDATNKQIINITNF